MKNKREQPLDEILKETDEAKKRERLEILRLSVHFDDLEEFDRTVKANAGKKQIGRKGTPAAETANEATASNAANEAASKAEAAARMADEAATRLAYMFTTLESAVTRLQVTLGSTKDPPAEGSSKTPVSGTSEAAAAREPAAKPPVPPTGGPRAP